MDRQTTEVESMVLGGLMIDSLSGNHDSWHKVNGLLCESDFSRESTRRMFRVISGFADAGEPYDPLTVGEAINDIATVGQVAANVTSTANLESYAKIVQEKAQKRRAVQVFSEAIKDVETQDITELMAEVQTKLESLTHRNTGSDKTFSEIITAAIESIDRASEVRRSSGVVGVPTGLISLDRRIGGLQAPRLVCVAARPSIGKTALINQITLNAAENGHSVGVMSLEMGDDELGIRAIANQYGLNGSALAFGDDAEIAKLGSAMGMKEIGKFPIYIDTETFSLSGIVSRISEWKRKYGIKLAVVDHIGLVEVSDSHSPNERLGKISRALKKLAKRINIPVVIVSQLNRNVEKDKRYPVLSDLRDSGSLEQDIDIGIFLHAEAEEENKADMELHIGLLKNRGGRKGWLPQRFNFNGPSQLFSEDGYWSDR